MPKTFRFATFNTALNRSQAGALIKDLSTPHHPQAKNVAEIIQRVNPDILALQEFDYDESGNARQLFQKNYLEISQNGAQPIAFKYTYVVPSNTGLLSGMDLDQDGKIDSPGDAFGFGFHPGQYAFAILSKYLIKKDNIRTFQYFLWKDMPEAKLPKNSITGEPWYSEAALDILRLSSKNHVDVPIQLPTGLIHVLVAHPTPPISEPQRSRNFDEIRLLADYITPDKANYLYDDNGRKGGLETTAHVVIMGDMNADSLNGNNLNNAINQLLTHQRLHQQIVSLNLKGNPVHHTATWGLHVDYVLPSKTLTIKNSGIFWPDPSDSLYYLVEKKGDIEASSDHRLVWLDLALP